MNKTKMIKTNAWDTEKVDLHTNNKKNYKMEVVFLKILKEPFSSISFFLGSTLDDCALR